MRILIDIQTLYTAERFRGIGVLTYNWLKNFVKTDYSNRYYLMKRSQQGWSFTVFSGNVDLDERLSTDELWHAMDVKLFIEEKSIDLVHFTSILMFDIQIPNLQGLEIKKSYYVYDLIPLAMKEHYYDQWPSDIKREYDLRCNYIYNADLILTDSDYTSSDLVHYLGVDKEKIATVYTSTNENMFFPVNKSEARNVLKQELGITSRFIFSLTGYNIRKNNKGLIESYSRISNKVNGTILVIAGIQGVEEREELIKYAQEQNISLEQILIIGYVSDEILSSLYSACELFVFPSYYEGFGIPILEAMRCGAPVIASNNSSQIEVLGKAGQLVDASDSLAIAEAILRIVKNEKLMNDMSKASLKQAQTFSWINTSQKSQKAFDRFKASPSSSFNFQKPVLAYFSPLNPVKSGISDYSEEFLFYLAVYFDIKVFTNHEVLENGKILEQFDVMNYSTHKNLLEQIPLRIYHMGNNENHQWIYEALSDFPGTVVLHDLNLYGYYIYTTFLKGKKEEFAVELEYNHGVEGLSAANELINNNTWPDDQQFPMFRKTVDFSTSLIVHSSWAKKNIELLTDYKGEIKMIPLGFSALESRADFEKKEKKNKLGINSEEINLGFFGNINPNRRLEVVASVFSVLLDTNPNTRLYIVGHADDNAKKEVQSLLRKYKIENQVTTVFSPEIDLFNEYISLMDICINLRWPTMGETSVTLMKALGYGVPSVVSDVGSYSEYPDDCVWKVDVDRHEQELLLSYLLELCNNRSCREVMGRIAKEYMMENHDFSLVAQKYYELIMSNSSQITETPLDL